MAQNHEVEMKKQDSDTQIKLKQIELDIVNKQCDTQIVIKRLELDTKTVELEIEKLKARQRFY